MSPRRYDDDDSLSTTETESLRTVQINAMTVVSWLAAVAAILVGVGWAWLRQDIEDLKSGRSTPTSHESLMRFDSVNTELARIRGDFVKMDAHDGTQDVQLMQLRRDLDGLLNREYNDRDDSHGRLRPGAPR